MAFIIVAGFAWVFRPHETIQRVGLGLLIAWAVYVPLLAHKRTWPRALPADAGLTTCLAYYKGELERLRDHVRNVWKWGVLPMLPGLSLFVGPLVIKAIRNPGPWINAVPFCVLLIIWVVVVVWQRRRKLHDYQREIDVLDAIQKGA